ncbi:beta strand repeat-containing protein [Luteolibacter soli]|uniref:Cadherin-like beta sandwich domain-containing protein n=1 Tax=Luteolibacter soli TaxID=3135280 RepID=A0ABU9AW90_9BACT
MRILSSLAALAFAAILLPAALHAETPATPASPAPGIIPWSEIGAKAGAQYQGKALSVTAEGEGALLTCGFQKMEGTATHEGLWLTSSADGSHGERFRVAATVLGRGEVPGTALPLTGPVRVLDSVVRWERAGLAEEYSVSVDGVRQDFVVAQRPAGEGSLRVDLALTGAQAEATPYGAKLTLEGSNRALAYSRLRVVDANGKELTATMQVLALDCLAICVEDADAAYPVRIDPTISDANWVSIDNASIPGVSGFVNAAVLDDSGNLYIGGRFGLVVTTFANNIAKWNGSSWSALGSGVSHPTFNAEVTSLAVSGTTLYAGGNFSLAGGLPVNGMAKWDGSAWSSLGAGSVNGYINALAVNGTTLYAAGNVSQTGGLPGITGYIAQMDLATGVWSGLGTPGPSGSRGVNLPIRALALRGTKLYVGGYFSKVLAGAEMPASSIALWDISTSTWSALGSGINNQNLGVAALAVNDTTVYAGGIFGTAGGVFAGNIAQWDIATSTWSAMGSQMAMGYGVKALALSGTTLYAAGAGPTAVTRAAKWDASTSTWSALGSATTGNSPNVNALAVSGTTVFAGGEFSKAGGIESRGIAKWEDSTSTWSGFGAGMNGQVTALAVSDTKLYAGGAFSAAGSVSASAIAQWDGTAWSALGTGIYGQVLALAIDGSTLYAGGIFTEAGGTPANRIAKWDGSAWSALGSGMDQQVNVLAMSGSTLYAGGPFTTAGGIAVNRIAKWDGSAWSALGAGLGTGPFDFSIQVTSLAFSGTTLYAGGWFGTQFSVAAGSVAKWDGSTWTPLGSGMNRLVTSLAVSGTTLYAGGNFTFADNAPANYIARWNGSSWLPLGQGMNDQISVLKMSGTTLYAGGYFTTADGAPANHIAQWNGSAWSALGSGTNGRVYAMALTGSMLYAGGTFGTVGANALSPYIGAVDLAPPTVAASTANLAATANSIVIHGTGFDWQASHNTVVFTPSGSGVITSATSTSLTVTGLTGLTVGPLNAVVGTDGYTSGAAVQVATVIPVAPVVTTPTSSDIYATSATLGGKIVTNGGAVVTASGVVYSVTSTNANPQIGGAGVANVTGTGSSGVFTVDATGLAPSVQYSFAAYATNSVGTTYTSPVSTFTTPNNVATLSNLMLSSGTLSPVFASGTLEYTAYVTSSTSSITFTPTTTDSHAYVVIDGWDLVTSGSTSEELDLSPGSTTFHIDVIAQDETTVQTYTVTVTQLTGYPDWRLSHFGTLENSGNTADTASYANDGISNLMKYALGLDPLVAANPPALTAAVSGSSDPLLNDRLAIRFTLPNPAPGDVTYTVQASPDLITWTDVATNVHAGGWTWVADEGLSESHILENDGGNTSTLQVGDLVPSSGNPSRMMRLKVDIP